MARSDGIKDRAERLLFYCAIALFGGVLGVARVFPFNEVEDGLTELKEFVDTQTADHAPLLMNNVYEGEGLVINVPEARTPGLTLVQGIMPGGPQIRMLDSEGKEIHRWNADFFKVFPNAREFVPANRYPATEHHFFIQGMLPLNDGSIVVNFGHLGAARLDQCSNVVWRLEKPAHHSVTAAPDGHFWIPSHRTIEETADRFLPRGMTREDMEAALTGQMYYHDTVVLVAPDGTVVRELSVLEAVFAAGLENAIYDSNHRNISDLTHLNDIEIVTPELAARIAGVEAGDLLLSLRDMHMLVIIDEVTGELLWHHEGPWTVQHDPDIREDGTIELFNNRSKSIGSTVDSSQIMHFDPADRSVRIIAPVGKDDRFFAAFMGSHQLLDDGNRLIVDSNVGRLIEVTPSGLVTWDYRLPYNEEYASLFSHAIRLPLEFYEGKELSCPQPKD